MKLQSIHRNDTGRFIGFTKEEVDEFPNDLAQQGDYVIDAIQKVYSYFYEKGIDVNITQYTTKSGSPNLMIMKPIKSKPALSLKED
jgi:hypothetical protein